MIVGARLRQGREAVGLTQKDLAVKAGIPQPIVSKIELGLKVASPTEANALADAIEVPVNYLFREPILLPEGSLGLFRCTSSKVKSAEFTSARRLAEIGTEAMVHLSAGVNLPNCRLRTLELSDIEAAGVYARSMLRLPPDEPVRNLTTVIERAGGLVLRLRDISPFISGFSSWLDLGEGEAERPLIVTRRPLGPFRLRFTVAHELGHLILGHQVFTGPKAPVEREANLFAQAVLMPKDPALEDLHAAPLDFERLAVLKGKWGMSMNAIAMRAKQLGVITDGYYYSIYEGLRARGWLKVEPGDLSTPCEEPRLLGELARRKGISVDAYSLAQVTGIGLGHARALVADIPEIDLSDLQTA